MPLTQQQLANPCCKKGSILVLLSLILSGYFPSITPRIPCEGVRHQHPAHTRWQPGQSRGRGSSWPRSRSLLFPALLRWEEQLKGSCSPAIIPKICSNGSFWKTPTGSTGLCQTGQWNFRLRGLLALLKKYRINLKLVVISQLFSSSPLAAPLPQNRAIKKPN